MKIKEINVTILALIFILSGILLYAQTETDKDDIPPGMEVVKIGGVMHILWVKQN